MENQVKNKFIGGGIIFPITINAEGRPDVVSDITLIRSSILTIINWPIGIRYFNERFGCRLYELLEEPDDQISRTLIRHFVIDALAQWEKRIELLGLEQVYSRSTEVGIKLHYRIRKTKIEETFIYPFYKEIIY